MDELKRSKSHPTAEELHILVRNSLPSVSLGTIYRNLDILIKQGLVKRLDMGNERARYDANLNEHCHIRCICCNRIDDLIDIPRLEDKVLTGISTDYKITGHHLEFYGICPACRALG